MGPRAREDRLVVQELPEEMLVYDLDRHKAHCLNRTAALVWRHCDGQTTVAELATLLRKELKVPVDEAVVWLALERLGRAHLLQERVKPAPGAARLSRREVMQKLALVGGLSLLVPVVSSIVAPTAAQAASCVASNGCLGKPNGTPCGPPQCTNSCQGGICD
jgi:hypothetical protein